MFFSKDKIVVFLFICFAETIGFAQGTSILKKFEVYQNDTINRIDSDGLKQGKWIYFGKDKMENGHFLDRKKQIQEVGYFSNNKKQYLWKSYFENGRIKSEITYENGIPKGSVKLYDDDGRYKEGGIFEDNQWIRDHEVYDYNGNIISDPAAKSTAYLEFSGNSLKLGKAVEDVKIVVKENQLLETEYITSKDGSFNIQLPLYKEFTINFIKSGFNTQSFIVNTNIYGNPETVYYLKDWKVNLSDNLATVATNEVLSLLLNKPINKINFDKTKKRFDSDGQYVHIFKQQAKLIGKTGEAMLSIAMQENKRLEIENLKIEAGSKMREIELLKKNNEIKNAELCKKEIELSNQRLKVEKKEQEQMLLDKEREIRKLNYQKEKEATIIKNQMEEERKAFQIEQLTQGKKLQELELQINKTKLNQTASELNKTTSALNITATELQKQITEAVLKSKEIFMLNSSKRAKDKELKDQQVFTRYISVGMGIIIIFSLLLYRNFLGKKKANQILKMQAIEINFQKKVMEEKNKGITDSINYAKLIQEAILPPKELKYRLFPDAFVLFQPKDIVSGDFYWFTEKNKKKLIATVDCTGHGVPGAFMSMIGNALLNEIINEKGITSPSEILMQLRVNIIDSLKQKDGQNKDGMDISILCFDEQMNTVEFAGANNPLWLIRNGEIQEIKADKQPIGLHYGESKPFSNHVINLLKNDSLYIFTDGYADQFGGHGGKKFKYKQLQNILLSIQDKPMIEQEKVLIEKMSDWKGDLEQVDDILIIGVRA
ncbi:MAG: SpoIIE family protein phosphatase [Bacteroidota bacterium]